MLVTPAPIRLLQVLACTRFQGNSCRRYGLDGDDDDDDNEHDDDDDDDDDVGDGDNDDTFIKKSEYVCGFCFSVIDIFAEVFLDKSG